MSQRRVAAFLVVVGAAALAGCSSGGPTATSTTSSTPSAPTTTLAADVAALSRQMLTAGEVGPGWTVVSSAPVPARAAATGTTCVAAIQSLTGSHGAYAT